MTEKRFGKMVKNEFNVHLDFIYNKEGKLYSLKEVCDLLNQLSDENEQLKQSYKEFEDECQSTFNTMSRKQNDLYRKNFKLKDENEQLKQQLFEARKDYLIETTDISDKLYLDDEIEKERREIFGDVE